MERFYCVFVSSFNDDEMISHFTIRIHIDLRSYRSVCSCQCIEWSRRPHKMRYARKFDAIVANCLYKTNSFVFQFLLCNFGLRWTGFWFFSERCFLWSLHINETHQHNLDDWKHRLWPDYIYRVEMPREQWSKCCCHITIPVFAVICRFVRAPKFRCHCPPLEHVSLQCHN